MSRQAVNLLQVYIVFTHSKLSVTLLVRPTAFLCKGFCDWLVVTPPLSIFCSVPERMLPPARIYLELRLHPFFSTAENFLYPEYILRSVN